MTAINYKEPQYIIEAEYCLMNDDRFAQESILYGSYEDMTKDVMEILQERNFPEDLIEEELDTIEYIILEENEVYYYKYDIDLRQ